MNPLNKSKSHGHDKCNTKLYIRRMLLRASLTKKYIQYICLALIITIVIMKRTSSLSTIGKIQNYYDYDSLYNSGLKRTNTKAGRSNIWVKPDEQKFDDKHTLKNAQHLIIVAGHSVIISGHIEDADINEKDWYLLDYQKGRGLPQAIVGHIREGIRLASEPTSDTDAEQSLLVFSGGETRPTTGPINEGSSYFHVADAMNLWDGHSTMSSTVRSRTVAEEFATDSFQNL